MAEGRITKPAALADDAAPDEAARMATAEEIRALTAEIARLNNHRFLRLYASIPRMLLVNFGRGLVLGLGTVIGASVLLSMVIWSLSQINFIPVIGDWAGDIVRQIEAERDK